METSQKHNKNICVFRELHKKWLRQLNQCGSLYLYGMTGFGKTTQALAFARENYSEWVRLSAVDENFSRQTEEYLESHRKPRVKTLVILDDLQWVVSPQQRQWLFELLVTQRARKNVQFFLVSRAAVPEYLSPLWVTRQMAVEDQERLRLSAGNIEELLAAAPALAELPAPMKERLIRAGTETARGYALGVTALLQRAAEHPGQPDTAVALATRDVGNFLGANLFSQWTQTRKDAVIRLSVFPEFTREMAREILGERTDDTLKDFVEVGSFLRFRSPDTYTFVEFFWHYLQSRLHQLPPDEWKPLYETAGRCYERQRSIEQALRCYQLAGRTDKVAELVVYLSENADGCEFARVSNQYLSALPEEQLLKNPQLLSAKVMLEAYRMHSEECLSYLQMLKELAEEEKRCRLSGDALTAYVRTVIACPYDTAEALKDNLILFAEYVLKHGVKLRHIMPTGNLPSLINGGLDLLAWDKDKKALYPVIKTASETLMGQEAVGIADASMGEILYEQNQKSKAMAYLTKALSDANFKGSIRVQYAVTGIMARLFQSEEKTDTAEDILKNIRQKALDEHFAEIVPNIDTTLTYCALLNGNTAPAQEWLETAAPDEHGEFYITMRYQLLTKARVYTALGRELDALHILALLEQYAKLYHRTYLHIELLALRAVILFRRGEDWQEDLLSAAQMAQEYQLVRVFADQGAALAPLWTQMDWAEQPEISPKYVQTVLKELKAMASLYPAYLRPPRRFAALTDKETEVLGLMARGLNNTQIAAELGLNLGTAKFHVGNILKKLGADNRTAAIAIAKEEKLI